MMSAPSLICCRLISLPFAGSLNASGGRAGVLHEHLAVGAHRLDAGHVAGLELGDQVGFLPAEEAYDLVVGVGIIGTSPGS